MSLQKWEELAKSKTKIGNKINFVRETIKNKKLGETISQEGYQKLFSPITGKLEEVAKPITEKLDDVKFFRFPKNKRKKKTAGEEEDDLELGDLFDEEDEDSLEYFQYDDNKILNDMGMENYKEFEEQIEFKGGDKELYLNLSKLEALNKRKKITTLKGINTRKINQGEISKEEGRKIRKKLDIQGEVLDRFSLYLKNYKTGKGLKGGNIMLYNNPNELLKKLEIILGEIAAGNTSIKMRNMGVQILDTLLKTKIINKTQHNNLYKYFNI